VLYFRHWQLLQQQSHNLSLHVFLRRPAPDMQLLLLLLLLLLLPPLQVGS
jgi:hypothetical protein